FHQDDVVAGGLHHHHRLAGGTGDTTERTRRGGRADERCRVHRQSCHARLVAENAAARATRGRVEGQYRHPVSCLGEFGAQLVDEGRLTDAGHPGDTDPVRTTGPRQQLHEQFLCLAPMVRTAGFQERDGLRHRATIPGADTFDVLCDVDRSHYWTLLFQPSRPRSCSSNPTAASEMTVPGPKIAAAPASRNAAKSCGGMTPPQTTRMSSLPSSASSERSAGTNDRCPAASEDAPMICTSDSTAWRATSAGVEKDRKSVV